jgi:hypothetical protein
LNAAEGGATFARSFIENIGRLVEAGEETVERKLADTKDARGLLLGALERAKSTELPQGLVVVLLKPRALAGTANCNRTLAFSIAARCI